MAIRKYHSYDPKGIRRYRIFKNFISKHSVFKINSVWDYLSYENAIKKGYIFDYKDGDENKFCVRIDSVLSELARHHIHR